MRLKTIWTVQYVPMLERLRQTIDWSAMATAGKLPKRIRYWATVIEIGRAIKQSEAASIENISVDYVLRHLEVGPEG